MKNWIWAFVILTSNVFGYKSNLVTETNWKCKSSVSQKIRRNHLDSKYTMNGVSDLSSLSSLHSLSSLNSLGLLNVRGGGIAHLSTPMSVEKFLYAVDLFGTGVFAFSGALIAGKKGMDLIGMLYIAVISATGGGTLRDLLLDSGAVFWIRHPIYFQICLGVTMATYLFWPTLESKLGIKDSSKSICTADAFGLGAFAVLGTQKAADLGLHPIIWIVVGTITSTFGGITRDILCLQVCYI